MGTFHGTSNSDIVVQGHGATLGDDVIYGFGGNDHIFGGKGNDVLVGGAGADELNGGLGVDTASYADSTTGVWVSLLTGRGFFGTAEGDTLALVENLTGSQHDDLLFGSDGANELRGLNGNDVLKGAGGGDMLLGGDGNDRLAGGSGADTMVGGEGDDAYEVDNASDVVTEAVGQGLDTVYASVSYALTQGAAVETLRTDNDNGIAPLGLIGNTGDNQIIGNNGDNVLKGGGGTDQLIGRGGNDLYFVDNPEDVVTEYAGQGIDEVRTSVSCGLTEGADIEMLRTTNDDGTEPISLHGNSSGNVVLGNNGENDIAGGNGNDELIGRGGRDVFHFNTTLDPATNVDAIVDFDVADDTIGLSHHPFFALGDSVGPEEFLIGSAAQDADDILIYDSSTGALFYDRDGAGGVSAVQFAELAPGLALTYADFTVDPVYYR